MVGITFIQMGRKPVKNTYPFLFPKNCLCVCAFQKKPRIVSKKITGRHCRACSLKLSSPFLFPSLSLISQSRQLGAIGNGTS